MTRYIAMTLNNQTIRYVRLVRCTSLGRLAHAPRIQRSAMNRTHDVEEFFA